jgi:hypothetical protein
MNSQTKTAIGDVVGARRVGREAVTVLDQQRDENGSVIARREQQAHRTQWMVEKATFFSEKARLARRARDRVLDEGAQERSHPSVKPSVSVLEAAAEFAAQRIKRPEDRERFMELLNERLRATEQPTKERRNSRSEPGSRGPTSRDDRVR